MLTYVVFEKEGYLVSNSLVFNSLGVTPRMKMRISKRAKFCLICCGFHCAVFFVNCYSDALLIVVSTRTQIVSCLCKQIPDCSTGVVLAEDRIPIRVACVRPLSVNLVDTNI